MDRKECLEKAAEIISGEREDTYGGPEDSFTTIAQYWTAHLSGRLDGKLSASDVAIMMAGLKLARLQSNATHTDSMVDCAGYMACLAEIATPAPCDDRR
ncbi:MAG: glutathionylspermidine synthase family protein [Gammaproteobacteria bacterium]|nr:glutathionylspermidine synthase family protein [Gammaproteobacteria bacterium]